ncbi:MAG: acyltransferase, partial [Betaproteobacteria bacterium]|nr:acyltransferase [Betaproteobacteria bacterium]
AVPPLAPRRGGRLTRWIGKLGMALLGWRVEGEFPNHPKMVVAGAPHSTNWDFPVAMSTVFALNLRIRFMAKASLFQGLAGPIMLWFGGLRVDRSQAADVVDQVVAQIAQTEAIWLCIAPEGTRKKVERFRSGFLRIARAAQIPIMLLVIDRREQVIRLGPLWYPTEDIEADRLAIEKWFEPYQAGR